MRRHRLEGERARRRGERLSFALVEPSDDESVLGGASLQNVESDQGRAAVGFWRGRRDTIVFSLLPATRQPGYRSPLEAVICAEAHHRRPLRKRRIRALETTRLESALGERVIRTAYLRDPRGGAAGGGGRGFRRARWRRAPAVRRHGSRDRGPGGVLAPAPASPPGRWPPSRAAAPSPAATRRSRARRPRRPACGC